MHNTCFKTSTWLTSCLAVALVLHMPSAHAQAVAAALPGGASSLLETFGDWQVACVVQGAAKHCALTQEQINQQSHQRVLAIEISDAGDKLEGVLLMPFGLALHRGVVLQIDDQPALAPLKFRTCLPGGCLVALNFDGRTGDALREGVVLKARAFADGGADQVYSISLKGFPQALDRIAVLSK